MLSKKMKFVGSIAISYKLGQMPLKYAGENRVKRIISNPPAPKGTGMKLKVNR